MKWRNDHLEYDWFQRKLPDNIVLGPNVYIESSYIFAGFCSRRTRALVMAEGSGAYNLCYIAPALEGRIEIGPYTSLNSTALIAEQSITIGAHCLFAWGSVITDSMLPTAADLPRRVSAIAQTAEDPLRRPRPMSEVKPVCIEDNVWVGFDSVIMGGVRIGRGAVIGCKTVITEDVPPYSIVVGNPSRILRYLEPDDGEEVRVAALREFGISIAA